MIDYKYTDSTNRVVSDGKGWSGLVTSFEVQAWMAQGKTPKPADPIATPIPSSLTMRQARLALLGAGLLDAVQAGVSVMPQAAQIEWGHATTVERASPLVATLAASLGLNSEALDALFSAGAAL